MLTAKENKINNSAVTAPAGNVFFKPTIQTKLSINQPNDIYEQEADATADKVMRMPDPSADNNLFFKPSISSVQRKCAHCEEEEKQTQRKESSNEEITASSQTDNYINTLSGGTPLGKEEKSFFEPRMGYDFSNVKIHSDINAAKSAQSINALAYTTGNNIVFASGQYQPNTPAGKQLLAHELTHTVQQKAITAKRIQRAPAGVSFDPPQVIRKNPLDKINNNETPGLTKLTINGAEVDETSFTNELADIKKKITPSTITQQAGAGNTKNCSFDPSFNLKVSANIYVITAPGAKGWSGNIDINKVPGAPQSCAGKGLVPANMTAKPNNQAYATLVEQSEMQHVKELEILHHRHLEPYYHFIKGLSPATGPSDQDCSNNLTAKIDKRDDQAALGFGLADIAETRKFDAPGSTHHGTIQPTKIGTGCSSAEFEASQDHPQVAGNQPGNVAISAPVQTVIDNTKLRVSGKDLTDTAGFVRSFSTTANAILALRIFKAYHIDSVNRIGQFEFILNGATPPTGTGPKANEVTIDPLLYQVTLNLPQAHPQIDPDEYMISQVIQDRIIPIVHFGKARDDAYSAIEQMRKYNFNVFGWIGANQDSPEFSYFKT